MTSMQAAPITREIRSSALPTRGVLRRNPSSTAPSNLDAEAQRLNSKQLRALSKQWRARAAVGEANAHRVADALMWVAEQRGKQEPAMVKVFASRALQWLGGRRQG